MKCQRCQSERIMHFGCKCSDLANWWVGDSEGDGYVPTDIGIGGGDYVDFEYCMDCGQIQGQFPLPPTEKEE